MLALVGYARLVDFMRSVLVACSLARKNLLLLGEKDTFTASSWRDKTFYQLAAAVLHGTILLRNNDVLKEGP